MHANDGSRNGRPGQNSQNKAKGHCHKNRRAGRPLTTKFRLNFKQPKKNRYSATKIFYTNQNVTTLDIAFDAVTGFSTPKQLCLCMYIDSGQLYVPDGTTQLPKAVTGRHTYGNSSFTPQCLQKANRKFPTRMSGERLAGRKHILYYLMNRSSRYLGNVQRSSSTRSSSLSIW